MASNFSKKIINKILRENYSSLGKIEKIYNFRTSGLNSIIFYFETKKKKFLIKIIPDPNKIYGNKRGQKRIVLITDIITKFSKKFKFERFVKNDNKNYSTIYGKGIIRVTNFIKPTNKKKNIYQKSINVLSEVHGTLWKRMSVTNKKKLKILPIPYSLDYTFKKNKKIKTFLKKEFKRNSLKINRIDIKKILINYKLLCQIVTNVKNLKKRKFFHKKSFTHNDFHQGNVIVDLKGDINLFDFDNIQYSNIFRCLYLFLLRFAFYQKKRNKKNFDSAFYLLKEHYYLEIPDYIESIKFTLYVEIEKIFKILCRVAEGNGLEIFIKKITKVHLPNILFLNKLLKNEEKNIFR